MKIYTKKGDQGETSLFGGKRLRKDSPRVDAYGTVDELNSCIGVVIDSCEEAESIHQLSLVQHWLFAFGAALATAPGNKLYIELPGHSSITQLEQWIDQMDSALPPLKHFILPSGYLPASHTHVARCVCRRAERNIVSLQDTEEVDDILISFFNRLSDYLFILARYLTFKKGIAEVPWKPDHNK